MDALDGSAAATSVLAVKWIIENDNRIAEIGVAFGKRNKECESQGASITTA